MNKPKILNVEGGKGGRMARMVLRDTHLCFMLSQFVAVDGGEDKSLIGRTLNWLCCIIINQPSQYQSPVACFDVLHECLCVSFLEG